MSTSKQTIVCAVCLYLRSTLLSCSGCWSPVSVTGFKPSPRSGHTLTAVDEKRAILFGGYNGERLNDVWLFDGERKVVSCCCIVDFCCDCWCVGVVSHHTILSTMATTKDFTHCVYNGV